MKTAVVYWSGTGNTEAMARAVAEGMTAAGAEAVLLTPAEVAPGDLNAYDAIAFGCPAMGSEVLEEMETVSLWMKTSFSSKTNGLIYTMQKSLTSMTWTCYWPGTDRKISVRWQLLQKQSLGCFLYLRMSRRKILTEN